MTPKTVASPTEIPQLSGCAEQYCYPSVYTDGGELDWDAMMEV